MKTLHHLAAIFLLIGVGSCSKDGPEGPVGPKGEQGERGEQGIQGIKGMDGTMLRYGKGAPSISVGQEGDFYIDMNKSVLYGPKAPTGWGDGVNVIGAKGDKGDKGDKGERGSTGATGAKGEKGDKGDKGDKGERGSTGATGAKGEKGDKGDKGDKGERGSTGATGAKGEKGDKGDKGDKGERGPTGATGAKGEKGDKGDTGATGARGQDGSQFLSGASGPTTQGKAGDFYFHTTTATLYGPKNTAGWGTGVSLKGPKGDKGEDGNANVITMGWTIVTTEYWKNLRGYSSGDRRWLSFDRPGDKALRVVEDIFIVNTNDLTGAVLVYANNGTGSRMLPFEDRLTAAGHTGTLEHRFVFRGTKIYMVVALRDGTWDTDYIMNTYLPSIRWKVVLIPEMVAQKHATALSKLNLNNYEAISGYFNLKD